MKCFDHFLSESSRRKLTVKQAPMQATPSYGIPLIIASLIHRMMVHRAHIAIQAVTETTSRLNTTMTRLAKLLPALCQE